MSVLSEAYSDISIANKVEIFDFYYFDLKNLVISDIIIKAQII